MEFSVLIGGLILFLYAIRRLSVTLQNAFSEKVHKFISLYTRNIYSSILIGTIVTIILDSSSAVIIIAIILINSGSLNFKQVMGIIMGANIGTTFSSQLIAMNINKYAVIPLFFGFILWFFGNNKVKKIGQITMYFGLLFFGLFLLEISAKPLKESDQFTRWILQLSHPLKGAAIGGLATLIIQSSSATIGMLITFAKQNLIGLTGALAIMLGAELGTCSDTLLAVIGGKREAIRAGVFHLLFNLIPILLSLLLFSYFEDLITKLFPKEPISNQIANAHVLFSFISVMIFIPFVKYFYKGINWLIPDKILKI